MGSSSFRFCLKSKIFSTIYTKIKISIFLKPFFPVTHVWTTPNVTKTVSRLIVRQHWGLPRGTDILFPVLAKNVFLNFEQLSRKLDNVVSTGIVLNIYCALNVSFDVWLSWNGLFWEIFLEPTLECFGNNTNGNVLEIWEKVFG